VLLLEEGRSVPADRLFELLWGDEAEPADRARLHTAVAPLRGLLTPYGARGGGYNSSPVRTMTRGSV